MNPGAHHTPWHLALSAALLLAVVGLPAVAASDVSTSFGVVRDPGRAGATSPLSEPLVGRGAPSNGLHPLPSRLALDLGDLVTLPAHATGRGWARFGLSLGLIGGLYAADESVRASLDPDHKDSAARSIRPLGQEVGLAFIASTWAIGKLADQPAAQRMGRDGVEAVALAAGILSPFLKATVGRERPRDNLGRQALGTSGASFPSGEVTEAFAIASVVATHSRRKWVKGLAWTLAGATAWQRLELDAHWASDVGAGALLGGAVGRWVVRRNGGPWSIEPRIARQAAGVSISRSF